MQTKGMSGYGLPTTQPDKDFSIYALHQSSFFKDESDNKYHMEDHNIHPNQQLSNQNELHY